MPRDVSPAVSLRFDVQIDGVDLGLFTELEGLEAEYEVEEYIEGGQNGFVHMLPVRRKYQNIKLTRAIDNQSGRLAAWFSSFGPTGGGSRTQGSVKAINANSETVATWTFNDAWPVKYSGPALKSTSDEVSTETLELAHHGFTQE